jgi:hypothetical protein
MFNSGLQEQIEEQQEEINRLREKLEDLEAAQKIVLPSSNIYISGDEIEVREVVIRLLQHLKLDLEVVPATDQEIVFKKRKQ